MRPRRRPRRFGPLSPATWLTRHAQAALSTLGRLSRTPLSTLMTVTVIAIALALPTGLHVMLGNARQLIGNWQGATSFSLFLKTDLPADAGPSLAHRLGQREEVAAARLITPDEALAEFRQLSGFEGALKALDTNPLPAVVVVETWPAYNTPEAAERLTRELEQMPEVDFAQMDLDWVRRAHALAELAGRAVLIIAALLGLGVLLVVGNTIRLEIENRRAEIEITQLIGGTDAFIRRPFLYCGIWYGLGGGLLAWLLVELSLRLLSGPLERLTGLYQSAFSLASADLPTLLLLLTGSALLGLIGSWVAVERHLRALKPE